MYLLYKKETKLHYNYIQLLQQAIFLPVEGATNQKATADT